MGYSEKGIELGVGGPGTQNLNLSLINRVTLNKSHYLSDPISAMGLGGLAQDI